LVADREDDAAAELVDDATAVRRPGQPRADQLLVAEATRAEALGERVPRVGGVADREAIQRLLAEATLREIRARALALRRPQQHLAVPADGGLERFAQPPASPVLPSGLRGELDPCFLGKAREGLPEIQPISLHQEGEGVAALATPEAVPALAIRVD